MLTRDTGPYNVQYEGLIITRASGCRQADSLWPRTTLELSPLKRGETVQTQLKRGRLPCRLPETPSLPSRAAAKNVPVAAKVLSSARPRARCNAVNRPPSRAPAGQTHRRTP